MKRSIRTAFLAAAAFALAACSQIDTGNVGVERTLGKVTEQALPPGVYFTVFKTVDEFTSKEIALSLNDMRPKSKDNLTMQDVDVDVYYKITPASIPKLFVKYQGDVVRHDAIVKGGTDDLVVAYNRVNREAREAIYNAVASFDATTMHTKRAELAEAIRSTLQTELAKSDPDAFTVTTVNVRNLVTDQAIENAIRSRAETDQAIEKKRKEIELARVEAERLLVETKGQADANRMLSASLTPAIKEIRLAELHRLTALSIANKPGNTVFLGANATPLVNVGK